MTPKEFFETLESLVEHICFTYKGIDCGVDPISHSHYNLWYGKDFGVECKSIDEVKNGKYFDGKSLLEIFDDITEFYH